jgi:hypothetical protein
VILFGDDEDEDSDSSSSEDSDSKAEISKEAVVVLRRDTVKTAGVNATMIRLNPLKIFAKVHVVQVAHRAM